jgi:hypothetical protein
MNYQWQNSAMSGHLMPGAGGSQQDNFTTTSNEAVYTANFVFGAPPVPPTDNITVNFMPDPSNPAAAQACTLLQVWYRPDQVLHVVFNGQGQSSYMTNECTTPTCSADFTGSASLTWNASWDVHIPFFQDSQPLDLGNYFAYISPALPGTTVTGTTSAMLPLTGLNCSAPPVFEGVTQAPYMGVGAVPASSTIPYPIVSMFVETFGGGVYHLCDGSATIGIGDQVPGYPGWDSAPGLFLFNVDLSQFLGQTFSMTMPVSGQFQPASDDADTGTVTYKGTLTFSTTPPGPCDPTTGNCPSSMLKHTK